MPACKNHPQITATWSCAFCQDYICSDCVESQKFRNEDIHVCKDCGGRVTALGGSSHRLTEDTDTASAQHRANPGVENEPNELHKGILVAIAHAIDLPFLWSGEGTLLLPMIAGFSLFLGIASSILSAFPVINLFLLITELMYLGWLLGVGLEVLRTSFGGGTKLTFRDHLASDDQLWAHRAQWLTMFAIAWGPIFVYLKVFTEDAPDLSILLLLLLWKDLYLTSTLPAYAWYGTLSFTLQTQSFRDAFRIGSPFLVVLAACYGMSLLTYLILAIFSFWGGPILVETLANLLFSLGFLLQMRWIGLLYHRHLPKLGW